MERQRSDGTRRLQRAIRAIVRRFSISERADVACCGMTVAQAATLETLDASGPLRLGALGRRLGIQPSTLTRNLARLEERGLVRRVADPDDARASSVALSDAGREAARRLRRQDDAFARAVLARLPAEKSVEVLASLDALVLAIREATRSCCPEAFDHLMNETPRQRRRGRRASA